MGDQLRGTWAADIDLIVCEDNADNNGAQVGTQCTGNPPPGQT
jgi:hypothetical protein